MYVPSGQGFGAGAGFYAYAYEPTTCFGSAVAAGSDSTAVGDAWTRVAASLVLPSTAHSIQVRLSVNTLPSGDVSAYFDEVYVAKKIFRDGFESGDVTAWSDVAP